ncbi:conserved Plasmodium protein, unknown function [Plasmodium sp. gorilla clade G2]|uniref:conserved Plasmodium protein, unknown function n=1 Tax=Plasmodium sp. gorilla clade G2 TaxID=880535 RepID=UPI000D20DC97|nr:conserved Plasmodium protein, unknown function [Plasmodium sp. gorilla clade G2]SOV13672.1 conserved Plasmodium protein, unknown function [Plasmodium sp. gorilla clade G2]
MVIKNISGDIIKHYVRNNELKRRCLKTLDIYKNNKSNLNIIHLSNYVKNLLLGLSNDEVSVDENFMKKINERNNKYIVFNNISKECNNNKIKYVYKYNCDMKNIVYIFNNNIMYRNNISIDMKKCYKNERIRKNFHTLNKIFLKGENVIQDNRKVKEDKNDSNNIKMNKMYDHDDHHNNNNIYSNLNKNDSNNIKMNKIYDHDDHHNNDNIYSNLNKNDSNNKIYEIYEILHKYEKSINFYKYMFIMNSLVVILILCGLFVFTGDIINKYIINKIEKVLEDIKNSKEIENNLKEIINSLIYNVVMQEKNKMITSAFFIDVLKNSRKDMENVFIDILETEQVKNKLRNVFQDISIYLCNNKEVQKKVAFLLAEAIHLPVSISISKKWLNDLFNSEEVTQNMRNIIYKELFKNDEMINHSIGYLQYILLNTLQNKNTHEMTKLFLNSIISNQEFQIQLSEHVWKIFKLALSPKWMNNEDFKIVLKDSRGVEKIIKKEFNVNNKNVNTISCEIDNNVNMNGNYNSSDHLSLINKNFSANDNKNIKNDRCDGINNDTCDEMDNIKCDDIKKVKCHDIKNVKCHDIKNVKCDDIKNVKCDDIKNVKCDDIKKVKCNHIKNVKCDDIKNVKCNHINNHNDQSGGYMSLVASEEGKTKMNIKYIDEKLNKDNIKYIDNITMKEKNSIDENIFIPLKYPINHTCNDQSMCNICQHFNQKLKNEIKFILHIFQNYENNQTNNFINNNSISIKSYEYQKNLNFNQNQNKTLQLNIITDTLKSLLNSSHIFFDKTILRIPTYKIQNVQEMHAKFTYPFLLNIFKHMNTKTDNNKSQSMQDNLNHIHNVIYKYSFKEKIHLTLVDMFLFYSYKYYFYYYYVIKLKCILHDLFKPK